MTAKVTIIMDDGEEYVLDEAADVTYPEKLCCELGKAMTSERWVTIFDVDGAIILPAVKIAAIRVENNEK